MSRGATVVPANDAALASYDFRHGALRGSHLALFSTRLEHRAGDFFEVLPLARMGALSAGFERDASRLRWSAFLLLVALLVAVSYWPLRSLVAIGFDGLNSQSLGGGAFLPTALSALDVCVGLLPVLAGLIALRAVSWLVPAWIGHTVLTVSTGAVERTFAARGRDPELVEFAETVAHRLGASR